MNEQEPDAPSRPAAKSIGRLLNPDSATSIFTEVKSACLVNLFPVAALTSRVSAYRALSVSAITFRSPALRPLARMEKQLHPATRPARPDGVSRSSKPLSRKQEPNSLTLFGRGFAHTHRGLGEGGSSSW